MSDSSNPIFEAYIRLIKYTRALILRVPTKSGRPKRGPRFMAIGLCEDEGGDAYGIVSSADTVGKRWACKTCFGFLDPQWSDGPLPDIEDIRQEWAAWVVTQEEKENSVYNKRRRQLGLR